MKVSRNNALNKVIFDKAVTKALGKLYEPIQLANSVNLHSDLMFKEGIEKFDSRKDLMEDIKARKELNDLIANFMAAKDKKKDGTRE